MTIHEAVKSLRKHLGQTQQQFAWALGLSITSCQNYERNRTPETKQLMAFRRAADLAGRADLAAVFRYSLADSSRLGPVALEMIAVDDEFESMAVGILLSTIRHSPPSAPSARTLVSEIAAILKDKWPAARKGFVKEAAKRGFLDRPTTRRKKQQ
ncbi:MAG: helix-turn-helix transcriptional regulator [Bryobacteraceae bacterium]